MEQKQRVRHREEAVELIECYLQTNDIPPHGKLPAEREMCEMWGLNRTTLRAAIRRLAEMDPEKYDEDLAKLELKAKRAAERKSEAVQHEKNLRRGIKRPKKQEVPDEKGAGPAGVSGKPSGEKQRRSAGVSDKRAEKAGPRRTAENGGAAKSFAKDDRTGRPFRKSGSRPSKSNRPKPKGRPNPYAHSRPVKKGKGSFRKKES